MHIAQSVTELVGATPLLHLNNYAAARQLPATLLAKVEAFNPGGSAKDRVALNMILDAEQRGLIKPGATIIEPTSGNTGVGLCVVAAARGYKCIIVMPDTMSIERIRLMKAYGAELVLTPGAQGMTASIAKAEELHAALPGSIIAGQFENPANPAAHYASTGPEIWQATEGKVDVFVAGAGTGGTVSGVGRYLKEKNPNIQIVAVEPADSAVLSGGCPGPHKLQGIGAGFVPGTLDRSVIDLVIPVTNEDAYAAARRMGPEEGLLIGISSGAALHAGIQLAKLPENAGKTIVVLLPDSGERYLSTDLYV